MGLTIHYELTAGVGRPQVIKLLTALRNKALDLPFEEVGELVQLRGAECDFEKLPPHDPHHWKCIQACVNLPGQPWDRPLKPLELISFGARPGSGCEQANFGLCLYPKTILQPAGYKSKRIRTGKSGYCWASWCKTQYASDPECGGPSNFLKCHLCVIRLLDFAQGLGILKSVSDEGEFWEKRDVKALVQEVGDWNVMIAGMVSGINKAGGVGPGEFAAPISEYADFSDLAQQADSKLGDLIKSVTVTPGPKFPN